MSRTNVKRETWIRVLEKRTAQLEAFEADRLRSFSQKLSGRVEAKLIEAAPSSSSGPKSKWVENVRGLLNGLFNQSVNSELNGADRSRSLDSLKSVLAAIDSEYADSILNRGGRGAVDRNNNTKAAKKKSVPPQSPPRPPVNPPSPRPTSNFNSVPSSKAPPKVIQSPKKKPVKKKIAPPQSPPRLPFNPTPPRSNKNSMGSFNSVPISKTPPKVILPPLPPRPDIRSLDIGADNRKPSLSCSLNPRPACRLRYDKTSSTMPPTLKTDFDKRLKTWDPYWDVITDFSKMNSTGLQTGKIISVDTNNFPMDRRPSSCLTAKFTVPQHLLREPGRDNQTMSWGHQCGSYRNGERRLIVRMLPVPLPPDNYKSDTHLWPKGTFVQINNDPIFGIMQRKQQSHDPKLWKGMCRMFDLSSHVLTPTRPIAFEMVSADQGCYGIQIAICEYNAPTSLLTQIHSITHTIPYREDIEIAKKYANCQTIVIDDSDDDSSHDSTGKKGSNAVALTLKLTCPNSLKIMEIPVRGETCKHFQCFDLGTFVHCNSFPSGRRWKCPVCDNFVNVYDLCTSGLFKVMLDKYRKEVSEQGQEDVEFFSDGTWGLAKIKSKKRDDGEGRIANNETKRRKQQPVEVILI